MLGLDVSFRRFILVMVKVKGIGEDKLVGGDCREVGGFEM